MKLTAGQTLGRYEILGYLGAGGMGVVYRARDSRLGREVAVKILNERAADSPPRIERFKREARAVARLSHPNILDIHDFGTHDGITYAVTELLHGQTLYDRLKKCPIPPKKGLEICRAIAEGLAAAHGEGIVHRDLKPSNIFITDTGQVKILDFGIARLREQPFDESSPGSEAPTESLTGTGTLVGTVGYMSPEQVDGGQADARSDIFGLGCVMYEILTCRRAFQGETTTETMLAILGKDPEPITALRPEVPEAIEIVVERCLEKQPGERYESAREVASALQALSWDRSGDQESPKQPKPPLRRVGEWVVGFLALGVVVGGILSLRTAGMWPFSAPPLPKVKHLAVIPFESSGTGSDLAQFAAGLGEIIASAVEIAEQNTSGEFWVIPPGDARYMRATTSDDMYRVFNATIALEGRLEGDASEVRLTLSLVNPATSQNIRTTVIEGHLGNVSSFQLNPFSRVIEILELDMSPDVRKRMEGDTTNVAQAFVLYVRGIGALIDGSENGTDTAIDLLEQATVLDPMFAAAGEALVRALLRRHHETGNIEFLERADVQLQEVLAIRPASSTYREQADFFTARGELDQAAEALEEATRLAPREGIAFMKLGRTYHRLGRIDDAERAYQRAMNLRPGYWPVPNRLANLYYSQGRYDAAANAFREVTEDAPLCVQGYNNLGAIYSSLGQNDQARVAFEKSIEVNPNDNYAAYSNLGTLLDLSGRFADAVTMHEKALAIEDGDYQAWGNYAYALTFSAQADKAVGPFARAIELAQERRASEPEDPALLSRLAGYFAMTGGHDAARELLKLAENLESDSPIVHATMGETYEDLGDREAALAWISRAVEGGMLPSHFERRPMLRDLVSDERYRQFVADFAASPSTTEGSSSGEK